MRLICLTMLVALSASAQNPLTIVKAACGPDNVRFVVTHAEHPSAPLQPDPGKALVYFVRDIDVACPLGHCDSLIALDGVWVGALRHPSWFSVFVTPGEHHACMNAHTKGSQTTVTLAHFTAEAGKVYYLRSRLIMSTVGWTLPEFAFFDSDEAKYQIASLPLSVLQQE